MPTRLPAPVFTVDAGKMHQIDTRNVENLYSMWTDSMEEGRRLENLSWRLWNRETLCCDPKPRFDSSSIDLSTLNHGKEAPSLSSSIDSADSEEYELRQDQSRSPPIQIKSLSSGKSSVECLSTSSKYKAKHISSQALEKMVMSIKETKINRKHDMTGLPSYITEAVPSAINSPLSSPLLSTSLTERDEPTPVPENSHTKNATDLRASQSSTSTAPLSSLASEAVSSNSSTSEITAPPSISPTIVRGFSPSSISVHRSSCHLSPATALNAKSPQPVKSCLRMKAETTMPKGANFMLGGSSEDEEASSLEERMSAQHSKTPASTLPKPQFETKVTSFDEEVKSRKMTNPPEETDVFESTDEEEDSESDGEDDEEDDDDWEDEVSGSGAASPIEKPPTFQRVESKPNLVSRRSLLTTMMHQSERAKAMAGMTSVKSQPNLQRSRASTPNGPSIATSPEEEGYLEMQPSGIPRSKPVAMPPPSSHYQAALSPRTTRRNMLSTELTESLRRHLLWERQQKNTTANAFLKRHHTAPRLDKMADMKDYRGHANSNTGSKNNSWNHYFDHGLGEYYQKGW